MWIIHGRFTAFFKLFLGKFIEIQDNNAGVFYERFLVSTTFELT